MDGARIPDLEEGPEREDGEMPVIVLIGGFGMTERHLRYHARLYRGQGATQILKLAYPVLTLTRPRALRREAAALEARLDRDFGPAPVVFHIFSGAIFLYHYFIGAMGDGMRRRVRGVVFESTPLDLKAEQFGRFLAWRLGIPHRPVLNLPFAPYRRIVGIAGRGEVANERQIVSTPRGMEALFITTADDPILSRDYIEAYAARIAAAGVNVQSLTLEAGRHCRAITADPAAYRAAIGAFVTRLAARPGVS